MGKWTDIFRKFTERNQERPSTIEDVLWRNDLPQTQRALNSFLERHAETLHAALEVFPVGSNEAQAVQQLLGAPSQIDDDWETTRPILESIDGSELFFASFALRGTGHFLLDKGGERFLANAVKGDTTGKRRGMSLMGEAHKLYGLSTQMLAASKDFDQTVRLALREALGKDFDTHCRQHPLIL